MRPIPNEYKWAANAAALRRFYEELITPFFPARFPDHFRLVPADWHLAQEAVHRQSIFRNEEIVRPIGTLDVEFLSTELITALRNNYSGLSRNYPCGMKCPGCFSDDVTYSDTSRFLTWEQMFTVIDDARLIGLKSIKFLGPGELFQNPELFNILDAAEKRSLPISIFTKGAELGDDELACYVYGAQGIQSAADLANRVAKYSCVRILLGFNSFDPIKQDLMVGSHGVTGHYEISHGLFVKRGVEKYTEKRNRALVNLAAAGLNRPDGPQRLSLIAAPVGLDQIDEIPEMYIWAARRNIPLVIAPTMESGPKAVGLMRHNQRKDPHHEKLKALYIAVYSRALNEGILAFDDLVAEGISAYMGTAACNQVSNGLYVRLNGQVQMCPGSYKAEAIFGNVHDTAIAEIWKKSSNYQMGNLENNWCMAKENGMPPWLQADILASLELNCAVSTIKTKRPACEEAHLQSSAVSLV